MAFSRREKFNTTPDLLYRDGLKPLLQEVKEYAQHVVWDDANRRGSINHMGFKAVFGVSDDGYVTVEGTIGFPATWQVDEKTVNATIDELLTQLWTQFA